MRGRPACGVGPPAAAYIPGSDAPACSSRAAHSRSCSSEYAESSIPACRSPRLANTAHGVGTGDGVVPGVLVVVDEELGGITVLAPPRGGDIGGRASLHLAGEGQRGSPD